MTNCFQVLVCLPRSEFEQSATLWPISPVGWLRHRVETGLAAGGVGKQVPRTTVAPPTGHLAGPEQIPSELKTSVECSRICLRRPQLSRWLVGPFTHAGHFPPASSQSVRCLRESQCSALPPCILFLPVVRGLSTAHPPVTPPLWFSPLDWSLQPHCWESLGDTWEVVTVLTDHLVKVLSPFYLRSKCGLVLGPHLVC